METKLERIDYLRKRWGDEFVEVLLNTPSVNITMHEFLNHCICCGGDWGQMLLTGIRDLFPNVYRAIPADMGLFAWNCLCDTIAFLGVKFNE